MWRNENHPSSYSDDPDPVKVLLEEGANINARDRGGETPLMYASNNGYLRI